MGTMKWKCLKAKCPGYIQYSEPSPAMPKKPIRKKRKRQIIAEQVRSARILISEAEHDNRQGALCDAKWLESARQWLASTRTT